MTTEVTPTEKYLEVQRSAEFAGLRRKLRNFVFPMTIAFFLWYALYVLLSAYARGFMSVKLIGNINVALLLGLLQFVSTFVIAWYYSRFAAKEIDPIADKINADLTAGAAARADAAAPARSDDAPETDQEAAK
ncbi:DUF485 domain-containing protein [Actinoplanes sp. NPDC049599]|uniref:DUF485 domain-containing protein n=1 Tax=Actinoplanes sp. NPDC049599 TaxID=3363903 RepID=UPI0037B3A252